MGAPTWPQGFAERRGYAPSDSPATLGEPRRSRGTPRYTWEEFDEQGEWQAPSGDRDGRRARDSAAGGARFRAGGRPGRRRGAGSGSGQAHGGRDRGGRRDGPG